MAKRTLSKITGSARVNKKALRLQTSPWRLNLTPQTNNPHTVMISPLEGERVKFPTINSYDELPGWENVYGFIYRITDRLTGKLYIGQKIIAMATKRAATEEEIEAARKLRPTGRLKIVRGRRHNNQWLKYWGSNKELKQDVKDVGQHRFLREIIELCCSKKYLSFAEMEQMFKHDVLRLSPEQCYNDNILGKFFRRDLLNCPDDEDSRPDPAPAQDAGLGSDLAPTGAESLEA